MPQFLIAVHAGAGYHSEANEDKYKQVLKRSCNAAALIFESGGSALQAVEAALKILEDDPITNAGMGSNLNIDGKCECDASVMDANGTFGAVAAAPGIKNPAVAATRLALDSKQPLSHGRVRPIMLAGDAARVWAFKRGLEAAATAEEASTMHVTHKSKRQYNHYMNIINGSSSSSSGEEEEDDKDARNNKRPRVDDGNKLNDTVGCCVLAPDGMLAAGVSSGGIALKTPGRVGEAAIYGAGCWAEQRVAVSATGVGERIALHLIAKESAATLTKTNDANVLLELLQNTIGKEPPPRECGVLTLVRERQEPGTAHVHAVHLESKSMAIAWLSQDTQGKRRSEALLLRRNNELNSPGQIYSIGLHLT